MFDMGVEGPKVSDLHLQLVGPNPQLVASGNFFVNAAAAWFPLASEIALAHLVNHKSPRSMIPTESVVKYACIAGKAVNGGGQDRKGTDDQVSHAWI